MTHDTNSTDTTTSATGYGRCFACMRANVPGRMVGYVVFLCSDCYADPATFAEFDPASGEYPIDAYAARLAWLLGSSRNEFVVDDWRAGPLVLVRVGMYQIAYGGDAAEEGAIGVGVYDLENESVHLPGITNEEGWIEAPASVGVALAWEHVRKLVQQIPGDVPPDAIDA